LADLVVADILVRRVVHRTAARMVVGDIAHPCTVAAVAVAHCNKRDSEVGIPLVLRRGQRVE
jgi:hypothetical protein